MAVAEMHFCKYAIQHKHMGWLEIPVHVIPKIGYLGPTKTLVLQPIYSFYSDICSILIFLIVFDYLSARLFTSCVI